MTMFIKRIVFGSILAISSIQTISSLQAQEQTINPPKTTTQTTPIQTHKQATIPIQVQEQTITPFQAQEQDGIFAGFGLGFGGGGAQILSALAKAETSQNFTNYDFNVGYKYFLNQWFGLRGYLSFGHSNAINKVNGDFQNIPNQDFNVNLIDYYANFDLLFNLYSTELFYAGLFTGMGIGGADLYYRDVALGDQDSRAFQLNIKAGARLNMRDHSVEFIAKFPFFGPSITLMDMGHIKMDFKQHYTLSMAYIYNFVIE